VRRLVASIRLSRETDTTNAPKTQRKDITAWVAEHPGNRIDYWTEDLDVSRGIPIAERPGIGPYLQPDRLDDWDGIIGWKLDRLFGDQLDYLLWVRDIGDKYGKFVVDAEDGTDSSTQAGRRILSNRAEAAQYERERMAERRSRAAREIRQEGRYGGGLIPFGLTKVPVDGGWALEIYEPYADEARKFAQRIIAGESANSVCADLNRREIPTSRDAQRILQGKPSKGGVWQTHQLLRYLRSETLKGYVLNYPKKGQSGEPSIVYGDDGFPVRRAAILDDDTWDELQAVIRKTGAGRRTGRRSNAATLLLGVAMCGECGGRLHSESKGRHSRGVRHYYGCERRHYRGCTARLVPRDELDERINYAMMVAFKDAEVIEVKRSHGNERDRKLRQIGQSIIDLTTERYAHGIIRPNYDEMLANLQAEEIRLRTTAPEPSEEKENPTGETIGELYERLNLAGRRALMQQMGFTFRVSRDADNQLHISDTAFSKGTKLRINLPEGITL
jgi:DNA invertase Pin-like site-specific DNA recombinase